MEHTHEVVLIRYHISSNRNVILFQESYTQDEAIAKFINMHSLFSRQLTGEAYSILKTGNAFAFEKEYDGLTERRLFIRPIKNS